MADPHDRGTVGARQGLGVGDTGPNDAPVDPRAALRQRRRARNVESLTTLYSQRKDIHGVSTVADFFVESTSWCA